MTGISIIIPTLEAAAQFPTLKAAFDAQSLRPLEVVVVDSSSSDDTARIATEYGWRCHVIPRAAFDHGGTRNLGASLAKGETLVFLTQDAVPADASWLANLVRPLEESGVAASFSRQLPRPGARPREAFTRLQNYPPEGAVFTADDVARIGIKAMFFSNVSSAIDRAAFDEAGGFPERAILNEDGYLAARLLQRGYSFRYEASSCVFHSHDYGIGMQFRRYFDIGVSHAEGPPLMRHARTTGAGTRFMKEQLRHLVAQGAWLEATLALCETVAKYVAYRFGRNHERLPLAWRRRLGWNVRYWEEPTAGRGD
jgi:rhamnosyltransferase